ncbi:ammonium transporter [Sulfitobacter mediterraneus]|jgi:ammonium transporter, Amt family|uniref:ammonium transporter n=1 Tax=Sulfitobacter mediterraneus TaxID=83219 RepID=UPI001932E8A8|nr:ammonium transporter [Sulfitobacter mediterraneus]MBM1633203.1 ammonium transporter [Sulfitobacter mediterraneus]MBM1640663.1 ammonium transporter [Sulfitobacter mediterraneus]MBM1645068.1 ammonium transporter [Sulfitobacter mediterraneus]MBM1648783.1 ammonium transporter [Sulfitobacter mediterraneus]MBM1652804.1 ammonium transporter [Sulfitobacter mediterraneus]
MTKIKYLPLAAAIAMVPTLGAAQDAEFATLEQTTFIFNTLLFLIGGFLVFWMAAGFAMLEAGLVRSKNVTTQLTKNMGLFGIAAIMYWLIGYNIMYPGDGNWIIEGVFGTISPKDIKTDIDAGGYSNASDFFFQLMFCATTASIVSGTMAERVKLWPFLIFVVVLTGIIYPIEASWQWGGGFLSAMGFSDFAGSTLVHAAGGFAALAGAIILGPRLGKYSKEGRVIPLPGSNLALATLGTFILWMGWFGFNGASQLAMGTLEDVDAVAQIFANTNMAAAAGAIAALILTQVMYGKVDLTMVLNGALAGLVSITAGPLDPTLFGALWIGAVGGVIVVFAVPFLDKLKIDDVVGAIPVHLIAGFWGTLVVPVYTEGTSFVTQIIGFAAVGIFVFVISLIAWMILKATVGIRASEEAEINGLDTSELGMEAYPEFSNG